MIRRPPRSTLFPTRRSSDLIAADGVGVQLHQVLDRSNLVVLCGMVEPPGADGRIGFGGTPHASDRKSTRLNSSHSQISYAVFCLKKKKKQTINKTSTKTNES